MIQFVLETDRALFEDAMRFAQQQVRKIIETHPGFYPMYTSDGKWKHEGQVWTNWCDGFFPGMMWIFHKWNLANARPNGAVAGAGGSADKFWREQAERYTTPLAPHQHDRNVHDLGFIFMSTYYRWYRLTQDPALKDALVQAGKTEALRFKENGQYLRSHVGEDSLFIDLMMNVGIIFYAARETGDRRLRDIALRHCLTTRRFLVRGDGSTAQEGIFDLESGEFLRRSTQQGYRGDSCWSRGLGWALYGFSLSYEYSRDPRFLDTAEACADYYITYCNADGVPPWDFNAPPESRRLLDTSAAAIAASGLLRLCRLLQDQVKGHHYWSLAIRILRTLCEQHLAKKDRKWEGILKGGVYHLPKELGVDESVIWGEYYFVEALESALQQLG
ncbi:MAG TPA: glycoside hydrolase family 88 protein [Bryobacteraceae bacterium]|nr:glycoside hydrolase family 88 protein [Bryobacteraceae bacterium]